jgi:predicted Rossmann fold flavoprotein
VTGSDGNGYKLAESLGHTIVTPKASLVPLVCEGNLCSRMMGLSLRNVSLRVKDTAKNKFIYEDFGEMLFTHYGVTGPLILSASAHIPDVESGKYELHINLKPALDDAELDARILSDFKKYANKDFINALSDLLPVKAIEPVVELTGIDPRVKVNAITKEQRRALVSVLHDITIRPIRTRPIAEAIVTKGGVKVSEVDPKTMESKLARGFYFAGEVLDVDAYTGGFNLQIAFSTARLAAQSAVWGG